MDNHQNNHDSLGDWYRDPKDEEHEDGNFDESIDDGQDTNDIEQLEEDIVIKRRNRQSMIQDLPSANNGAALDRPY